MRLVALSIVILAGALMAGAGVIADALPAARQHNSLEACGLVVVGIAILLFVIEWWPMPSRPKITVDRLETAASAA
jgi:hypothetical protein